MAISREAKAALKERERLIAERANAREAQVEHRERVERIRAELKPIGRKRQWHLRKQARSGEPTAEVARLDQRKTELTAELERESEAAKAAVAASKSAGRDLQRLHADEFGAFAEHAQSLTEAAEAKLAKLRDGYVAAYEAIEAARAEWSRIVGDRESVRLDRANPAERVGPQFRQAAISPPPPNPLPPPGAVFPGAAIRPVEVEPVGEEAIADVAA